MNAVSNKPSSNNPCPFLRSLVAQRLVPNEQASIEQISQAIQTIMRLSHTNVMPQHADLPLKAILATANGFSPLQVAHNVKKGVRLDKLRFGPFYKQGNGSRLLDNNGEFDEIEFERLKTFASQKYNENGEPELGMTLAEIHAMLHANFLRAQGTRKYIDRGMMEAEFPALLAVFGKSQQSHGIVKLPRYLAVDDIEKLFKFCQFPIAIQAALAQT